MIKKILVVACGLLSLPALAESQASERKYGLYLGAGPEYAWLGTGLEIKNDNLSVLMSVGQVNDVDENGEEQNLGYSLSLRWYSNTNYFLSAGYGPLKTSNNFNLAIDTRYGGFISGGKRWVSDSNFFMELSVYGGVITDDCGNCFVEDEDEGAGAFGLTGAIGFRF